MASDKILIPLKVAFDGIALGIDDSQEAYHTLQAFIDLIQDESTEVQAAVAIALLTAMGRGNG